MLHRQVQRTKKKKPGHSSARPSVAADAETSSTTTTHTGIEERFGLLLIGEPVTKPGSGQKHQPPRPQRLRRRLMGGVRRAEGIPRGSYRGRRWQRQQERTTRRRYQHRRQQRGIVADVGRVKRPGPDHPSPPTHKRTESEPQCYGQTRFERRFMGVKLREGEYGEAARAKRLH
ncbi:hypothetical protein PG997_006720 [Apiospora hydei]|uniref:Uncharacterized protein n=1 Tax=Apiospora hydei TaxID=1337664 RepID=A0ABR1WPJ7_9PEZI